MADDLADDFLGAAVIGFGSAGPALEGGGPALRQQMAELEVAGFGIAELAGGGQRAKIRAFPFIDHGQFERDFIVLGDFEFAGRAGEEAVFVFNGEHGSALRVIGPREEDGGYPPISLIKCGAYPPIEALLKWPHRALKPHIIIPISEK